MHQSKIMTYRLDLFITPEGLRRAIQSLCVMTCRSYRSVIHGLLSQQIDVQNQIV